MLTKVWNKVSNGFNVINASVFYKATIQAHVSSTHSHLCNIYKYCLNWNQEKQTKHSAAPRKIDSLCHQFQRWNLNTILVIGKIQAVKCLQNKYLQNLVQIYKKQRCYHKKFFICSYICWNHDLSKKMDCKTLSSRGFLQSLCRKKRKQFSF